MILIHIGTVSEELVSQNTDFPLCIFCTSAVLFFPLLRLIIIPASCMLLFRKVFKNGKRLVANRL